MAKNSYEVFKPNNLRFFIRIYKVSNMSNHFEFEPDMNDL